MIRLLPTKPFGKNASSQRKVGPRNAILGLCKEELIKGYLRGNIQTDASDFQSERGEDGATKEIIGLDQNFKTPLATPPKNPITHNPRISIRAKYIP